MGRVVVVVVGGWGGGPRSDQFRPPTAMPNFSPLARAPQTSEPAWGPIMDMTDIARSHAIWLNVARGRRARVEEGRTSDGEWGKQTSDEKRGRVLS